MRSIYELEELIISELSERLKPEYEWFLPVLRKVVEETTDRYVGRIIRKGVVRNLRDGHARRVATR